MKRAKKAVLRSFLATEPESGLTSARTVRVLCIAARAVQLGSVAAETKGTHPALGRGRKSAQRAHTVHGSSSSSSHHQMMPWAGARWLSALLRQLIQIFVCKEIWNLI